MQIDVKEIEPCKLNVTYVADAGEILNKRGEIMTAFKKAPVPGFREGKASMDAIRVHYKNQIEESLKRALAEDAYHNTLFEKKVKPHGPPRFNSLLMADGKFTCEFELHTKPNFDLVPYEGLEIPKPHAAETEVEIAEKLIQELRVRFGEAVPYGDDDFVQNGDNVIINYEGSIDGEISPHLCAEGEMLTVGASKLTSFDDQLLGMKMGDEREFDIVSPEGSLPSIVGKTVHLKVTLTMGSKSNPCPLDDTLAQKVGRATLQEVRDLARGTAAATLQNKEKVLLNEAISNKLIESNTIDVPNWMALSEAQYLAHNAKLDWSSLPDVDKEQYLNFGARNVKLTLILDRIREERPEAQLTDQEVFEIIKKNLAASQVTQSMDEVIQQMNRTGYLQILFSRIRDEHTLDFVTKNIKLIE